MSSVTKIIATISIATCAFVHAVEGQSIGQICALKPMVEGARTVPVGVDQKALDEFYKSMGAQDSEGMMELVKEGRLLVPDTGTKVRVLDAHGFLAIVLEVRILEGVYKGRRCFVSSTYVSEK